MNYFASPAALDGARRSALRRLLAKAGAARSFSALQARLDVDRRAAREVFDAIFRAPGKT